MKPATHYAPTETGFAISGSPEVFNRTLYGGHANDHKLGRFFTFAGDAPQFMGAISNWTRNQNCNYEKCGVLTSGLAITPGRRTRHYYSADIDQTSRWFHNSEDVRAEFKNGWMEYALTQMSGWFPDVRVKIEAYPLLPDEGYLVHYHITTDQRVFFTAGFGGITDPIGRFEFKGEPRRYFSGKDTKGNRVTLGENRACVTHSDGKTMRVATSFPADFSIGSAKAMADIYPSTFLGNDPENEDDQVVRISTPIEAGQVLDGYIIAIHDVDDAALDKWLAMDDPIGYIKSQIYAKTACIDVSTPERALDLTVAPTVMAIDASWHKDSFHHGAFAYHAPFLGWRNWYAPTALGWHDRVSTTAAMWLQFIGRGDIADEKTWYDDSPAPEGQFRWGENMHKLENAVGILPAYIATFDLQPKCGPYNMQECALDEILYYIEWTGDMAFAEKYFDDLCAMADFEARIFDPDDDGLYQNVLNTWISDGHNYNGAGCNQSSAYNYRANLVLAKLAEKLGRDGSVYAQRAEKIKKAMHEKLWLANDGVFAESLDTMGNCLIHPAVELPSIYHIIDSDVTDDLRAYRSLKYTENHLKNIETVGSGGRLCFSSNWLPKQYSNCGIFPSENAHLALVYFKLGLKEEGMKLLTGIADCYFTGKNPGMAAHIQSARGTCDLGDQDFSDVSSTYLRLMVEGLFGIRIDHLNNRVNIAPGFPNDWDNASLTLKDIALQYNRRGNQEIFTVHCDKTETKCFRIPMRAADVEAVMIDGETVPYEIVAAPNNSFLMVKTDKAGRFQLRVMHGSRIKPTAAAPSNALAGSRLVFEVKNGTLVDVVDISEALEDISVVGNKVYATVKDAPGDHTLFLLTVSGEYGAWLAADYEIVAEDVPVAPLEEKPFEPLDISKFFNCNMSDIHKQCYNSPKPEGYSMSTYQNGLYSHGWNQYGHLVAYVDDSSLRNSGGTVYTKSGIPFATPAEKENVACVSLYDVFPTAMNIPLSGKAQELAVLFVAVTNCMQSYVENARITVTYADGTEDKTSLVYPLNIDDWLTSALTTEAECFYFSNFNHATVQRIRLDPGKELASVRVEAIANEVTLGVAGISISR